jgi:hypothetical protein
MNTMKITTPNNMKITTPYTEEDYTVLASLLKRHVITIGRLKVEDVSEKHFMDYIKDIHLESPEVLKVLLTPYDQLPLLINHPNPEITLTTQWRLSIGK